LQHPFYPLYGMFHRGRFLGRHRKLQDHKLEKDALAEDSEWRWRNQCDWKIDVMSVSCRKVNGNSTNRALSSGP
jgi:hypothetical protein